ncbi:MAG: hypothetical protein K0S65_5378 [Labilithrix sp.]|nr:hypothetical protein [Labilithrix sp.]
MRTYPIRSTGLPAPIASYFESETTDAEALARCFTEDATVLDEGHEHRGRAAIAAWNAGVNAKYALTTELLETEGDGEHTTVRAKVTGNFPGSPVELRFRFTLAGAHIARLEIAP